MFPVTLTSLSQNARQFPARARTTPDLKCPLLASPQRRLFAPGFREF
jgi:hypothetical protein